MEGKYGRDPEIGITFWAGSSHNCGARGEHGNKDLCFASFGHTWLGARTFLFPHTSWAEKTFLVFWKHLLRPACRAWPGSVPQWSLLTSLPKQLRQAVGTIWCWLYLCCKVLQGSALPPRNALRCAVNMQLARGPFESDAQVPAVLAPCAWTKPWVGVKATGKMVCLRGEGWSLPYPAAPPGPLVLGAAESQKQALVPLV